MKQKNYYFYKLLYNPYIYNILQYITLSYSFRKKIILSKFLNRTQKFLDIGCGTANVLEYINDNVDYFGFDTNLNYINYAKKKYNKQNFFCKTFSNKNIKLLPNFDFALLSATVHHLPDKDVYNLLELINRKLNKNGKLLIIDPFISKKKFCLRNFFAYIDRGKYVRTYEHYKKIFTKKMKIISIKKVYPILPPHNWVVTFLSKN